MMPPQPPSSPTPPPPSGPPGPHIRTTARRGSSNGRWGPIVATLCLLAVLGIVLTVWLLQRATVERNEPPAIPPRSTQTAAADGEPRAASKNPAAAEAPAPDPLALWQPPTNGPPIALQLVPQGVKCLVHLNVQRWRVSTEAQRTWRALGPAFARCMDQWQQTHDLVLQEQQRILWAVVPRADGTLGLCIRGEPRDSWSVPASWKPISGERQGRYRSGHLEAITVSVADQRYWLLGPPDLVGSLAARAPTATPLLQRQLETLRRATDRERQMTVLATASFLWTHGADFGLGPMLEAIELHCGDGLQALALSGDAQDDVETYLELHTVWRTGAVSRDQASLLDQHRQAISLASRRLAALRPVPPYWQTLAERVPQMLTMLQQQVRVQPSSRVVMANASLPPAAAHNLALAGELMLNLKRAEGGDNAAGGRLADAPSHRDPLQLPVTYQFDQQSLVDAVAGLEAEVQRLLPQQRFSIQLDGEALRAEGITRNQQIKDFRLTAAPLTQHLTEMVRQANPGRAKSLTAEDQKLVWAVPGREPKGDATVILITTRKAAVARSLELPAVFVN